MVREVGVDLPWLCGLGIGRRVAKNGLAAQAHFIQPVGLGALIDLDITQGLVVGQLGEGHGHELVHAGEILDLVIAAVPWFMVILCLYS